jgi:hypothetical protein
MASASTIRQLQKDRKRLGVLLSGQLLGLASPGSRNYHGSGFKWAEALAEKVLLFDRSAERISFYDDAIDKYASVATATREAGALKWEIDQ